MHDGLDRQRAPRTAARPGRPRGSRPRLGAGRARTVPSGRPQRPERRAELVEHAAGLVLDEPERIAVARSAARPRPVPRWPRCARRAGHGPPAGSGSAPPAGRRGRRLLLLVSSPAAAPAVHLAGPQRTRQHRRRGTTHDARKNTRSSISGRLVLRSWLASTSAPTQAGTDKRPRPRGSHAPAAYPPSARRTSSGPSRYQSCPSATASSGSSVAGHQRGGGGRPGDPRA